MIIFRMSSIFSRVIKQAKITYDKNNASNFRTNFQQLIQLTDQLTLRDINIDPEAITRENLETNNSAPCTFIDIYQHINFNVALFILRENFTLPLHDHPQMHGILRVLAGEVKVQSFTKIGNESENLVIAQKEPVNTISSDTKCGILTPTERNYHEVTANIGPAAVFDILSPPYDSKKNINCTYYKEVKCSGSNNEVYLEKTFEPEYSFFGSAKYFKPDFLLE